MSFIKKSELKQMNTSQVHEKLNELQKELMKLRAQIAMHTSLENPGRVKSVRKMIARMYTKLNETKQKESSPQPVKKATSKKEPAQKKTEVASKSISKKKTKEEQKTKK